MIREGDMERGSSKPPYFDGTNYAYWKIHMSAYLQSLDWRVWEICEDPNYEVLAARVGQEQIDKHNTNSRAHNALFSCLSPTELDRVSHLSMAREIWGKLLSYHEGTS